ncbi:MAG: fibronectin type III domain-containing protein [Candidatus Nanopelagicales bacterium]
MDASATSVRVGGLFTTVGLVGTPGGSYFAQLPAADGPPGQPTKVAATGGDASALVTWTAPTDTNGGSITGYRIETAPGPSYSAWSTAVANTGSATPSYTVTGLTNGTNYVVRVSAISTLGTGSPSAASSWFRPMAASVVPTAPTGVSAVPGSSRLTASWTASSSPGSGATAIIRYRAVALNSNGVLAGYCQTEAVSSPDTTCVIKGLTPGVPYTVKVRSWNNLGKFGDFSAASTPAQPTT